MAESSAEPRPQREVTKRDGEGEEMSAREVEFGRLITAMVTPFHRDGAGQAVDYEKAARMARILAANGTQTIVVSGTTGESPNLSIDEKLGLFRTVRDAVAGHEGPGAHKVRRLQERQRSQAGERDRVMHPGLFRKDPDSPGGVPVDLHDGPRAPAEVWSQRFPIASPIRGRG
jgi:hypothetical protein